MSETDLQLGGGYTYQWQCAILLALNYFFEPVRYNPTLFDLVSDFLDEVTEVGLEGVDQEKGVDLEDIRLGNDDRHILIQVKTKQAKGERWTPTDPLLLKALYKFYDSRFFAEQPDDVRFVFLTNRPFNPVLVRVKSAIGVQKGTIAPRAEVDTLCQYLARYARQDKKQDVDPDRLRQTLARTALVEYLAVDEVKANVQAKLQAHGRRDWRQAHALLFEHFAWQSTRVGGGAVTYESIVRVLGPPPEAAHPRVPAFRFTAPAPPSHFTGRESELDTLAHAITAGDTPQGITALQGMGGIGKTALAAELAARLPGALPGGVFWADLPANDGKPEPVLRAWARLCDSDESDLPDPQACAQAVHGLLVGRVAERGLLLIVLDDVRLKWLDGAQVLKSVRPPDVPLLLTTREARVAQALRARVIHLDTISPDEARDLLVGLSDGALTGGDADRVAELCGYLPLALELAAAVTVQEGAAWLLPRLDCAATRLDTLELDDPARKDESVRLTFDLSYRTLAERYSDTARAFRCLGVFAPIPVNPARLAGILAETRQAEPDPAQTEAADIHLRRLTRWALVRREPSQILNIKSKIQNLYTLHPLLRDYAAALLEETGEAETTRDAHTAHYLAYAEYHGRPAADYDVLEAEHQNLMLALGRLWDRANVQVYEGKHSIGRSSLLEGFVKICCSLVRRGISPVGFLISPFDAFVRITHPVKKRTARQYIEMQKHLREYLRCKGHLDDKRLNVERAYAIARTLGDKDEAIWQACEAARLYSLDGCSAQDLEMAEGWIWWTKMAEKVDRGKLTGEWQARILRTCGVIAMRRCRYEGSHRYEESRDHFQNALKCLGGLERSTNTSEAIEDLCNLLAKLEMTYSPIIDVEHRYQVAIEHLDRALDSAEKRYKALDGEEERRALESQAILKTNKADFDLAGGLGQRRSRAQRCIAFASWPNGSAG